MAKEMETCSAGTVIACDHCERMPATKRENLTRCPTCDIRLCSSYDSAPGNRFCWDSHRCGQSDVCPDCKGSGIVRRMQMGTIAFSIEGLFGPPETCPSCSLGQGGVA